MQVDPATHVVGPAGEGDEQIMADRTLQTYSSQFLNQIKNTRDEFNCIFSEDI